MRRIISKNKRGQKGEKTPVTVTSTFPFSPPLACDPTGVPLFLAEWRENQNVVHLKLGLGPAAVAEVAVGAVPVAVTAWF